MKDNAYDISSVKKISNKLKPFKIKIEDVPKILEKLSIKFSECFEFVYGDDVFDKLREDSTWEKGKKLNKRLS